jgi:uncharacterized protein YerC
MNKLADQLLYADDLKRLYDILNDLLDAQDKGELSNPRRVARIVHKLETFTDIHKVRTNDLITLKEKVEKARSEYRILNQKYRDAVESAKMSKQLLNKVLNDKMEGVDK